MMQMGDDEALDGRTGGGWRGKGNTFSIIKAWMLTVCGGRGRQRLGALGQVRDAAVP